MANLNLERGLTRCYLVLWGLWLGFVTLRAYVLPILGGWPIKAGIVVLLGIIFPGVLLLACRWAGRGFRLEKS